MSIWAESLAIATAQQMCTSQLTELFEIVSYSNAGLNSGSWSKINQSVRISYLSWIIFAVFVPETASYCDKYSSNF